MARDPTDQEVLAAQGVVFILSLRAAEPDSVTLVGHEDRCRLLAVAEELRIALGSLSRTGRAGRKPTSRTPLTNAERQRRKRAKAKKKG